MGILICILTFIPNFILQESSAFVIHDQLEEIILTYILSARNSFCGTYPEMMCGLDAGMMTPPAICFVPLYMLFSPFWAFICYASF